MNPSGSQHHLVASIAILANLRRQFCASTHRSLVTPLNPRLVGLKRHDDAVNTHKRAQKLETALGPGTAELTAPMKEGATPSRSGRDFAQGSQTQAGFSRA